MELNEMVPDFLINMLNNQYGEEITKKILNGYEAKRKVTLRVNTLKTNKILIQNKLKEEKIDYETVKFYKDAIIIKNANEKDIR